MEEWIEKALALNKTIRCLRTGFCCFIYSVVLPNGTIKPENSFCPYYDIEHNQAICKIYDNRPFSCQIFVIPGIDQACALGTAIRKKWGPDFVMKKD